MNCDSTDVLIATYGINWQSMVTVISGPYESLENCQASCGGTTTTTTTGEPTTTTPEPLAVQPLLVAGNNFYNINDYRVTAYIEYSDDYGDTWTPFVTSNIFFKNHLEYDYGPGTSTRVFRVRCSPYTGGSLSAWSWQYTYPNPDNVLAPVVNGSDITNINNFSILAAYEYSNDNGVTWFGKTIVSMNQTETKYDQLIGPIPNYGLPYIFRARCAKWDGLNQTLDNGASVSPYSS